MIAKLLGFLRDFKIVKIDFAFIDVSFTKLGRIYKSASNCILGRVQHVNNTTNEWLEGCIHE